MVYVVCFFVDPLLTSNVCVPAQVRLCLISPTYLFDHVTKDALIKGNPQAMALLMEAMEYHLLPDRRAGLDPERTRPRSRGHKTQVSEVMHSSGSAFCMRCIGVPDEALEWLPFWFSCGCLFLSLWQSYILFHNYQDSNMASISVIALFCNFSSFIW